MDSRVEPVVATANRYGLLHPVVLILLAAGSTAMVSGDPIGGGLLAAVGVGLALSRAHPETEKTAAAAEGQSRPGSRSARWSWAVAAAMTGYAAVAAIPPRFSWPATVLVVLPGVLVIALARRLPVRSRSSAEVLPGAAAPWVVVLVGIALWELVNLLLQPSFTAGSYDHPTLSVLAEPILAGYPGRFAGVAAWLAVGWYLLERR